MTSTFRRKPQVKKPKPVPLEIGTYLGERIAEWSHQAPTKTKPQTLRLRFVYDQKLEAGQTCYYYLWDPYVRLPVYIEAVVNEVEPHNIYWYDVVEITSLLKWPPGPGYA